MLVLAPKLAAVLLTTCTLGAVCTGPSIAKASPPVSRQSHSALSPHTSPASAGESVVGGNFTCSGLLPGIVPNLTGGATPGTCNEVVTFSNTGTTAEDFDIILGTPSGSGPAIAALDQLLVSYATLNLSPYTTLSYAAISSAAQPMQLASLQPGQSITVWLVLSLLGGVQGPAANAWNGATVHLPYTVTATATATVASGTATVVTPTPTVSITNIPSSAVYGGIFTPTFVTSGHGTVFAATSSTLAVCTVGGSSVNFVGVGTCTLTSAVAATADYTAATGSAQSFSVGPATPTVSITNMPTSVKKGGSFVLTFATSGNGTVFSATSTSPSVCTVSGSSVNFVGVGACSLTATVAATADYTTASSTATTQSSSAATIPPTKIPSSAPGTGGGGAAWVVANGKLLVAGALAILFGLAVMGFVLRRRRFSNHRQS